MGELSRIFGAGATIEHAGKTYTLSAWTYKIQGEYELYLETQAWETVKRAGASLGQEALSALRAETARDITAGAYSSGSEQFAKSLWTPKHARMFMYLLIEPNVPDVTMPIVQAMYEDGPEEFLRKLWEAGSDPTRPPETKVPAGAEGS